MTLKSLNQILVQSAKIICHDSLCRFADWKGAETTSINFLEVGVIDLAGPRVFSQEKLCPDVGFEASGAKAPFVVVQIFRIVTLVGDGGGDFANGAWSVGPLSDDFDLVCRFLVGGYVADAFLI
jgi:hypothetical protein